MLRNYLKTSLRSLLRYPSYSFINIFGLTIGLATSIFIFLWIADELSYDRFHKNPGIYRVISNFTYTDGTIETGWSTPLKLAGVIQAEVPEIDQTLRMGWPTSLLFKAGDKSINESGFFADSTIFSIFSFPIVKGDTRNPLPTLNAVAISEKLAAKFFGEEDPIGKVFRVNQQYDLTVTAVFADIPKNSTLAFDFILPFSIWEKENTWAENWGNNGMQTYVSLKPGASLEAANEKVFGIIKKHCKDCISNPFLFPFKQVRLYSEFENGKNSGGRIDYVMTLSVVAFIIVIIACINFMNLATARSATRSREIGVRKAIGAQRRGIVVQFIGESILLSLIAMIFAVTIVQLVLPLFNQVTDKSIVIDVTNPILVSGIILITLFTGLIAGSYPALFLSSFKPAVVLKGTSNSTLSGGGLRKTLVVIQFITSTILITGSLVVYNQITFIRNTHLGFDRENIIVVNQHEGFVKNKSAFKNDLLQLPSIKNIAVAGHNPFSVDNNTTDPAWPGKPKDAIISFKVISCDYDFIPTLGMQVLEGRNFTDDYKRDSSNYIINEKAMEVMGLTTENVIGTELDMWNGKGQIIGVVGDFNNGSLKEPIMPLVFVNIPGNTWRLYIKAEGNMPDVLKHVESIQKKYDPDYPFEYSFLDEEFDSQYRSEATMGKLSLSFTVVAIIISCLGLFGLAAFTAERRVKELGVRKVLGATVFNLITLLCGDFAKLVFIALVAGIPVAWYLTHEYLTSYTFHAELTIWVFALPALGILLLTLITVGYQSTRAAMRNPATSLRNE